MTTLPLPVRSTAARHWYDRWFEPELPGPATLAEHVLATGCGRWWTDELRSPHVVLVCSGSQRVLRGDPDRIPDSWIRLLARGQVSAPPGFTSLLADTGSLALASALAFRAVRTESPWSPVPGTGAKVASIPVRHPYERCQNRPAPLATGCPAVLTGGPVSPRRRFPPAVTSAAGRVGGPGSAHIHVSGKPS